MNALEKYAISDLYDMSSGISTGKGQAGHVHSHFIINSVSLEDGRKLHISEPELVELRQRNDQVCQMFGLPVFQKDQKKKKVKSMLC